MPKEDPHLSETIVESCVAELEQSIPVRFEKIVRKFPKRLAVKMGDRSLTYGELHKVANRLARAIIEKCGPGSEPIALFFKQEVDFVVAVLGTLKAGKFCVALDAGSPNNRVNYALSDSQSRLIVTNDGSANFRKSVQR